MLMSGRIPILLTGSPADQAKESTFIHIYFIIVSKVKCQGKINFAIIRFNPETNIMFYQLRCGGIVIVVGSRYLITISVSSRGRIIRRYETFPDII